MNLTDYLKGALVALGVLVMNVLLSVLVMVVYSYAIEPGHDAAFYEAAAPRIAPWSSVAFGIPLFYGAARLGAHWRPERNATAFAVAIVGFYALIDVAALLAEGVTASGAAIVGLSMGTKLGAALLGARGRATRTTGG